MADTGTEPSPLPADPSPGAPANKRLIIILTLLFTACLAYAVWVGTLGLHNTLYSDTHAFRQTQTAISCFYMLKDGYTLNYQTPVLGPNWHLPFEFPIYQWIVVAAYKTFGDSLDATGRLVSFLFYMATLIPIYLVLPALGVQRRHRLIFPIIFAVSPFYLYWSRAFLMETTALFFSVSFAVCVIRYAWGRANGKSMPSLAWLVILAALFGTAASTIKLPTFITCAFATALYVFKDQFTVRPKWSSLFRGVLLLAAAGIIPVLAGLGWNHYGDSIRAESPMTASMVMSSKAMVSWSFGTLRQRLSPAVWRTVLGHGTQLIDFSLPYWIGCLLCLVITRRRWKEAAACAALFLTAPALFTNLHFIHTYYMCANGVFLLMAVGFVILGVFESSRGTCAGIAALLITVIAAVHGHHTAYYSAQTNNKTTLAQTIQTIADRSTPDSVVVYLGLDWAPTIPYYTQRRALMIPDWPYLTDDQVRAELKLLKTYAVGPIVVAQTVNSLISQDRLLELMRQEGLPTDNVIVIPN